jgi:hypothetical protein
MGSTLARARECACTSSPSPSSTAPRPRPTRSWTFASCPILFSRGAASHVRAGRGHHPLSPGREWDGVPVKAPGVSGFHRPLYSREGRYRLTLAFGCTAAGIVPCP